MGAEAAAFESPVTDTTPPRRQHVLLTADTVGGVWTYALELSRALIERGHRVTLATMGALPDDRQRREAAAVRGLAMHSRSYRLVWMENPWADVRAAGDWLLELAERVKPTVVHLNDLGHGALPWRRPVLTVGHSCVMSWWRAVHGVPAPPTWDAYRRRVRRALEASDMVVAPTTAMMRELQFWHGPLGRRRVIANGRASRIRGARQKAPIVFAAGRLWDEAKNIGALASVAGELEWPVYVAGSQAHPDGGSIDVDNVRLLGQLASGEMLRWYARASIYALPARYEPFGLSALEAAQARCALVLGDIASLREVWGGAALFVPANDPEALAYALRRLIRDEGLRTEYGERACRRAAHYTPGAMAAAYEDAYARIAEFHSAAHVRPLRSWSRS